MNAAKACLAAVTALGICVAAPGCASSSRPASAPARPNPLTVNGAPMLLAPGETYVVLVR